MVKSLLGVSVNRATDDDGWETENEDHSRLFVDDPQETPNMPKSTWALIRLCVERIKQR